MASGITVGSNVEIVREYTQRVSAILHQVGAYTPPWLS